MLAHSLGKNQYTKVYFYIINKKQKQFRIPTEKKKKPAVQTCRNKSTKKCTRLFLRKLPMIMCDFKENLNK